MKNKIKIYLLLIALGIGSVSCLDKYPDDAIQAGQAIKTVDDANQAIIGIYAAFKDASLYSGRYARTGKESVPWTACGFPRTRHDRFSPAAKRPG